MSNDLTEAIRLAEGDNRPDVAAKLAAYLSPRELRAEVNALADRLENAWICVLAAGVNGRHGSIVVAFRDVRRALAHLDLVPKIEEGGGWLHVSCDWGCVTVAACSPVADLNEEGRAMLVALGWDGQPRGGGR